MSNRPYNDYYDKDNPSIVRRKYKTTIKDEK
jgi:hypothetical protein